MWWFQRPEHVYRRRLRQRLAIAQRLARDVSITRLQRENQLVSDTALRHTQDDEDTFTRLFGEPLPAILHTALHLERETWTTLTNNLHRQAPEQNQRLLRAIQQILATEQELVTTPLTKRYERRLEQVRKEELRTGR
jgi:hypothetical protein